MFVNFKCLKNGVTACTILIEVLGIDAVDSPEERVLAYKALEEIIGEDIVHHCVIVSDERRDMVRFPEIWVMETASGYKHLIGSDRHDSMFIDNEGNLYYHNLQNGEGAPHGDYTFTTEDGNRMHIQFSTAVKL